MYVSPKYWQLFRNIYIAIAGFYSHKKYLGLKNICKVAVISVLETTKLSMADKGPNIFAKTNFSSKNDSVRFISILHKKEMLLKWQWIFQMDMVKNVVGAEPDHKDIKCKMKYIVWWTYIHILKDILNHH